MCLYKRVHGPDGRVLFAKFGVVVDGLQLLVLLVALVVNRHSGVPVLMVVRLWRVDHGKGAEYR